MSRRDQQQEAEEEHQSVAHREVAAPEQRRSRGGRARAKGDVATLLLLDVAVGERGGHLLQENGLDLPALEVAHPVDTGEETGSDAAREERERGLVLGESAVPGSVR